MSIDDEWGRPAEVSGEYARPSDLKGHLLIVYPLGYVQEIQTRFGTSDGIAVDVIDLDDKDEYGSPGKIYRASNFMQAQLIASLKSQVGSKVLGIMSQGVSKNGMNPPWVIIDQSGDAAARERAAAWKQAHPNFRPSPFAPRDPSLTQSQPQGQSQGQQQRPAQQQPEESAILRSMTMNPVAGSPSLSSEEQNLLAQFRERQRQAQAQQGFEDQAPF